MSASDWKFAWQWLGACVGAKLVQILLDGVASWGAAVSGTGRTGISAVLVFLVIFRLFSGAIGGWFQWLVLRQRLPAIRYWVLATSVGGAIAFVIIQSLWIATQLSLPPGPLGSLFPPQSALPDFALAGIFGLVVGIAQWLVLRGKLPEAGWWVAASAFGTMLNSFGFEKLERLLGVFLGPNGIDVGRGPWNPFHWGISALSTLLYAALTGGFLLWNLHPHKPE